MNVSVILGTIGLMRCVLIISNLVTQSQNNMNDPDSLFLDFLLSMCIAELKNKKYRPIILLFR